MRLTAILSRIAPRILIPITAIAVPASIYTLGDGGAEAFRKDEKCFSDLEYKKALFELAQANAEKVKTAFQKIDSKSSRQMRFKGLENSDISEMSIPPEYVSTSFLKSLSCTRLYDILIAKKRAQDAQVGRLIASQHVDDPRKTDIDHQEQEKIRGLFGNFQCLSKVRQSEILCAVGNVALFGTTLSSVLNPNAQASFTMKGLNPFKAWLVRKQSLALAKPSAIDTNVLAQNTASIWEMKSLSDATKVELSAREYMKLRLQAMPVQDQKLALNALSDIRETWQPGYYFYNSANGKIYMNEMEVAKHPVGRQMIIGHELEHLTQFKVTEDQFKDMKKAYMQMLRTRTKPTIPVYRQQSEYEAIGAQYDLLQGIPREVRMRAVRAAKSDRSLSPVIKDVLVNGIEKSIAINRENYVKAMGAHHGYLGFEDLQFGSLQWMDNTLLVALTFYIDPMGISKYLPSVSSSKASASP